MSQIAPVDPAAPISAAELRAAFASQVDRITRDGAVTSCSGLDSVTEQLLYAFLRYRDPAALAAAYAANERRIAGWP